jgi:four helix bundle protein
MAQVLGMQDPKNLAAWQHALELSVSVYRLTEHFPSHERFGMTSQMRRAAVSIGCNITEGCGRWGNRELVQYLQMAYSSAGEVAYLLTLATKLEFGDAVARHEAAERTDHVQRMLNRLMATKRKRPDSPRGKRTSRDTDPRDV